MEAVCMRLCAPAFEPFIELKAFVVLNALLILS